MVPGGRSRVQTRSRTLGVEASPARPCDYSHSLTDLFFPSFGRGALAERTLGPGIALGPGAPVMNKADELVGLMS